jgi:thiol-disulfide isomerase/thioredoxin
MPASHAVNDVTDATFAQAVLTASNEKPVVVDFWAPWCGPCRMLGPIIERVAAEHSEDVVLVKLNTDENPRRLASGRRSRLRRATPTRSWGWRGCSSPAVTARKPKRSSNVLRRMPVRKW